METDILEVFLAAEKTHGVRYLQFVDDGGSSVHPKLIQNIPEWGREIRKLEGANNACKCYKSGFEKLVADNSSYTGNAGLTQNMRNLLTSAARCATKIRSQEPDTRKAVKLLVQDLVKGSHARFP